MKDIWIYLTIFFAGSAISEFFIILFQMKKMGDNITIRKQVQRNRRSPNNNQEYQATQQTQDKKKRKIFNLKHKKDGNIND